MERMGVAIAMSVISRNVVKNFKEDALYELVHAIKKLENGETFVLYARKSGMDNIERFRACLFEREDNHPTDEECLEYAKRTLGVDVIARFIPDEETLYGFYVDIEIVNPQYDYYEICRDLKVSRIKSKEYENCY